MSFQTDTRLSRQKQIHSLAVYHEAVECVSEGAEYRFVTQYCTLETDNLIFFLQDQIQRSRSIAASPAYKAALRLPHSPATYIY